MSEKIQKTIHRQRIGEFGKGILIAVATTGLVLTVATLPGLAYIVAPFVKRKKRKTPKTEQSIEKSLDSLSKNGFIKYSKTKDGKIVIELTQKGKLYTLCNSAGFHERIHRGKAWDKKWRIVVFDVPESKRATRDRLREAVVMFGFVQIQKSVWAYPYPCDDFVLLLKKHLKISKNLLYITADYLENDVELRRKCKLSSQK